MSDFALPLTVSQVGQRVSEPIDLRVYSEGIDENKISEIMLSLRHCLQESSVTDFKIMPNFSFGWLKGPNGYVASFKKDKMFQDDLFKSDYFRVISIAEVLISDLKMSIEKQTEMRSILRKVIPIETETPPNLDDHWYSGWGPALGTNGSYIGLESFEDRDDDASKIRWFIIVVSGLHYQTVQMLQNRDIEISLKNRELNATFDASEQLHMKSKIDLNDITYEEEFKEGGIKDRMLRIAIENNRRLIALYADAIDIPLINTVETFEETEMIAPEFSMTSINKEIMLEAIQWWPKNRIIYPSTIIYTPRGDTDISVEAKKTLPRPIIHGAKIGAFCKTFKKENPEMFEKLVKNLDLKFLEHPISSKGNVEMDYNTFRRKGDFIIWYNNCADVTFDPENNDTYGIIIQDQIGHGLLCMNCKYFSNDKVGRPIWAWKNSAMNAYPVIYPYDPNPNRNQNISLVNQEFRFFSLYHGGGTEGNRVYPKQLQGTFKTRKDELDMEKILDDLVGDYPKIIEKNIRLGPRLIYLSPGIIEEPKYNFYRGDII